MNVTKKPTSYCVFKEFDAACLLACSKICASGNYLNTLGLITYTSGYVISSKTCLDVANNKYNYCNVYPEINRMRRKTCGWCCMFWRLIG